jgi:hypothetical protein
MRALPLRLVRDVVVDVDVVGAAAVGDDDVDGSAQSSLLTAIELVGSPLSGDHCITLSTTQGVS